jgi:gas vesicle protein
MKYETEGKYEASGEASKIGTAITFLLIGLGAGALVGMLLAPKAGKQIRKELRRRYEDARETFDDWKDEAIERGTEIAEDLKDRVTPLAKAIRKS